MTALRSSRRTWITVPSSSLNSAQRHRVAALAQVGAQLRGQGLAHFAYGANAETISDTGENTAFDSPLSFQVMRIDSKSLPIGFDTRSAGHSSMPTSRGGEQRGITRCNATAIPRNQSNLDAAIRRFSTIRKDSREPARSAKGA